MSRHPPTDSVGTVTALASTVRDRQTGWPGGCRPTSTRYGSDRSTRSRQRRCSSGSWKPASGGRSWLTSVPTPQTASGPTMPRVPPGCTKSRSGSSIPISETTARSGRGRRVAVRSASAAPQEKPHMPTAPSHHGCAAAHSTAATPSSASAGSNGARAGPSEEPSPRQSTSTQPYPPAANRRSVAQQPAPPSESTRYGISATTAGTGPAPTGRTRSAPRPASIRTPRRTDTSYVTCCPGRPAPARA